MGKKMKVVTIAMVCILVVGVIWAVMSIKDHNEQSINEHLMKEKIPSSAVGLPHILETKVEYNTEKGIEMNFLGECKITFVANDYGKCIDAWVSSGKSDVSIPDKLDSISCTEAIRCTYDLNLLEKNGLYKKGYADELRAYQDLEAFAIEYAKEVMKQRGYKEFYLRNTSRMPEVPTLIGGGKFAQTKGNGTYGTLPSDEVFIMFN